MVMVVCLKYEGQNIQKKKKYKIIQMLPILNVKATKIK